MANPRLVTTSPQVTSVSRWMAANRLPGNRPTSPPSSLMTYQPRGLNGSIPSAQGLHTRDTREEFDPEAQAEIISTFALEISSEESNSGSGSIQSEGSHSDDPGSVHINRNELGMFQVHRDAGSLHSPEELGTFQVHRADAGSLQPSEEIGSVTGPDVMPPMQNPLHRQLQNGNLNPGYEPQTSMQRGSLRRSSRRRRDMRRRQLQHELSGGTEESMDDALSLYYMKERQQSHVSSRHINMYSCS